MKKLFMALCCLLAMGLCACSDDNASGPSYYTDITQREDDSTRAIISSLLFDNTAINNTDVLVKVNAEITNNSPEPIEEFAYTGPVINGEIDTYTGTDAAGNTLEASLSHGSANEVAITVKLNQKIKPGDKTVINFEYTIKNAVIPLGNGRYKAVCSQLSPDIAKAPNIIENYRATLPENYFYKEAFPAQAKYKDGEITYRTTTHSSQFSFTYGETKSMLNRNMLIYILFPLIIAAVGGTLYFLRKMK